MSLFRMFYSLRLAVVSIILLTLLAVVGGVLPQGGSGEMYYHLLPVPLANVVLLLGLDHTFSSPLFLIVAGVFILNLAACTVRRFRRQGKMKRRTRNFGPDILHVGILVLIAGGLLTALGREEQTFLLTPGEEQRMERGYRIALEDFEFQRYADGSPKDWISTVRVYCNDELLREKVAIEVNSPLRLGAYTLYQVHHTQRPVALFRNSEAQEIRIVAGQWVELPQGAIIFSAVPEESGTSSREGVFMLQEGMKRSAIRLTVGDTVMGLALKEIRSMHISGLKAVRDPGYRVVVPGFILAMLGLVLTYAAKFRQLREDK